MKFDPFLLCCSTPQKRQADDIAREQEEKEAEFRSRAEALRGATERMEVRDNGLVAEGSWTTHQPH